MPLQALLISRDGDAVSVLQKVMRQLDVESEVCAELQPAVERLAQGATSAVVVDYDVEHATELLKLMRQNYPGTCVALAMVKGMASIQAAYDMGANFVLIKPVSPDAASRSLAEATALVRRMLRRPSRLVVPRGPLRLHFELPGWLHSMNLGALPMVPRLNRRCLPIYR